MMREDLIMDEVKKEVTGMATGSKRMEYALQRAWLISLLRNEYITESEFEEGCKKLDIKYHQTNRV